MSKCYVCGKDLNLKHVYPDEIRPIEDTDDIWKECSWRCDDHRVFQCQRMSSLFKYIYNDGTVAYSDNDRVCCVDIHTESTWSNGILTDIIDELFPITMPYLPPSKPYIVYFEDFLSDLKNGDYDTKGVLYVVTPDGERIEINRFFGEIDGEFKEITKEEYEHRKLLSEGWREVGEIND